ncbi:MAG: L-lactate MFS transporter [Pauljensenia sp.]
MEMTPKYHRWAILVAACALVFCTGSIYAFSVFRDQLADQIGLSSTMTAYSINSAIAPIPMILGGYFVDHRRTRSVALIGGLLYGAGWLLAGFVASSGIGVIFAYGIVGGMGQGLVYAAALNNTLRFFPDRRGLASGLITGANGGATIVMAPVIQTLLSTLGLSSMMIAIGVVFLVVGVAAFLVIRQAPADFVPQGWTPPTANGSRPAATVNMRWREMVATPMFWLIFFIFICGAFSGVMISGNASPIAQGMYKYAAAEAAVFVSLYSFSNLAGRLIWGTLSDRIGRVRSLQIIFVIAAAGLVVVMLGKGEHRALPLAVGLLLIGTSFGGIMATMPTLVMGQFGPANQGINYGIVFVGYSVAALLSPRIGASIGAANNGDFSHAFVIAICAAALGVALASTYQVVTRRREQARTPQPVA